MKTLNRHPVQQCADCPHNLQCLAGVLRKHYPYAAVCPMCGLVRLSTHGVNSSDDDCAEPHVRCHELQHNMKKVGLWTMRANGHVRDGGDPRLASVQVNSKKPHPGFCPTYLHLCDECAQDYTPNKLVSLYDILSRDGVP